MKRGQKSMECPTYGVSPDRYAVPFGEGEHGALGRKRPITRLFTLEEGGQCFGHPWSKRHEPVFAEFCLANHQKLGIKVNIPAAQPRDFPDSEPQAVKQSEDHLVYLTPIQSSRVAGQLCGNFEKTTHLIRVE